MDVKGSLRSCCPENAVYLGLDIEHGRGVDIVVNPRDMLPIRSEFSDITLSTSQMEHDPRFWVTFLELCRVTKNCGVIYMSAPSNGNYHSYPQDVWRFYPDYGKALVVWASDNGHEVTLIESLTARRKADEWNDFVAVFYVGKVQAEEDFTYLSDIFASYNAWQFGSTSIINREDDTEDQTIISIQQKRIIELGSEVSSLSQRIASLCAPDAPQETFSDDRVEPS